MLKSLSTTADVPISVALSVCVCVSFCVSLCVWVRKIYVIGEKNGKSPPCTVTGLFIVVVSVKLVLTNVHAYNTLFVPDTDWWWEKCALQLWQCKLDLRSHTVLQPRSPLASWAQALSAVTNVAKVCQYFGCILVCIHNNNNNNNDKNNLKNYYYYYGT